MKPARQRALMTAPRRGLRLPDAAVYVGVSETKFLEWVREMVMPRPKEKDGIVVWDIAALDVAFEALPTRGEVEPDAGKWERVTV